MIPIHLPRNSPFSLFDPSTSAKLSPLFSNY